MSNTNVEQQEHLASTLSGGVAIVPAGREAAGHLDVVEEERESFSVVEQCSELQARGRESAS